MKQVLLSGNGLSCPVSARRINENGARIAAAYTIGTTLLAVLTGQAWLVLFLAADFGIRAFTGGDYSLLRLLSIQTGKILRVKNIPVDAAPKKFAAGVGFGFSLLIAFTMIIPLPLVLYPATAILLICAFLEAALGYCVGCVVYSFLMRFFGKAEKAD